MKKFVCPVCGYVYEGEFIPEGFKCPVCGVDGSKFKVMEEGKLAAEHEYGIYAKTVKNNPDISEEDKKYIFEQLMANFQGECSEVGMYLCMARIAHREGYPEIGLYWEKAAHEEAEHAAKFAEMLGEDLEPHMKATTKDNLAWRVDCEFGATQGKFDLAACAKKNGLDAIHDTVHEMAQRRSPPRQGSAGYAEPLLCQGDRSGEGRRQGKQGCRRRQRRGYHRRREAQRDHQEVNTWRERKIRSLLACQKARGICPAPCRMEFTAPAAAFSLRQILLG